MKSIINNSILILAILLGIFACEEKELDHLKVTSVESLYTPENDKYVQLQSSASASVLFEWELAKAEDGGLVMYEVAFDTEGGDFSEPVYKLSSDNSGALNRATVTHKVLNQIAALAGIGSSETGKLIWTVISSKGINEEMSSEVRTIEITRLAGFADVPVDVFVTGEGSENGGDLASAIKMKSTAPGEFEVYTKLDADKSYHFVDRTSGTPRTFYISGEQVKEGGSSTMDKTAVYRINLDFNTGAAVYVEVADIELYFSPTDEYLFSHEYQGNGIWKASEKPITFKQESWGRDERYKFKMTIINGAGETIDEWWGTPNIDHRPSPDEPASYYHLFPVDDSRWDGKFKFASEMDQAIVDVTLFFNADGPYTHEVVKVGDQ